MKEFVTVYDCDVKGLSLWSILGNFETVEQALPAFNATLERIKLDNAETVQRWQSVHGEKWRKAWADLKLGNLEARSDTLRIMTLDEYDALHYASLVGQPLKEIDADRFMDLLECLPPLAWKSDYLFESFLMSEQYSAGITTQIIRIKILGNDRYFEKLVDVKKRLDYDQTIELIKKQGL